MAIPENYDDPSTDRGLERGVGDHGGNYELVVSNIDETGGQESSVSGNINPGQTQNYSFNYDNESSEPVVIEEVQE